MCLIVLSWQVAPCTPLFVAANRDEYYARPASAASWWHDAPTVFAPRDLEANGTWMGVAKIGSNDASLNASQGYKFAALTNVRDGLPALQNAPSRGHIVSDFLKSDLSAEEFLNQLKPNAAQYNGFNLLIGEVSGKLKELRWFSNKYLDDDRNGQPLATGIYGLSNGALNANWPKVCRTKADLVSLLCQRAPLDAYFEMLSNNLPAPDCRLPDTGVSLEWERLLSSNFIQSEHYGTRSSAILSINGEFDMHYNERIFR